MLGFTLLTAGAVLAVRPADSPAAVRAAPVAPASVGPVAEAAVGQEDPPRQPRATVALQSTAPTAHPARGRPQRVVIPELGVDAPVIGIDAPGGVLRPPDDPQVLGWWRAGAAAGAARGSTLVTGHTVSVGGGALDDLDTLTPGDRVAVRTAGGTIDYQVVRVTVYRKARLARHAARIFSQTVPGRLVLVTCEDWNGSVYLSNAVVVARPSG